MDLIAILFLAALLVGYFVLAGCDIGLGMLMPYLARQRAERHRAVASIAPYFLGTEIWLVGAVGVVAGVFPEFKNAVLLDLWPVLIALTAAWLLRDAGLWLWARFDAAWWRRTCENAITAGSWLLSASWGLIIAGLLSGGTLLSPFALVCALSVMALFALRGAAFGAERLVPVHEVGTGAPPLGGTRQGAVRGARSPSIGAAAAGPSSAASTVGAVGAVAAEAAQAVRTDADHALGADLAARSTRLLARGALGGVVLAALLGLLPGGLAVDRPLPAGVALVTVLAALTVTTGLSGPHWSRYTSAYIMAAPVLLVAAGVALPGMETAAASVSLVAIATLPALPVMIIGQLWLHRLLRRPAAPGGFFA